MEILKEKLKDYENKREYYIKKGNIEFVKKIETGINNIKTIISKYENETQECPLCGRELNQNEMCVHNFD